MKTLKFTGFKETDNFETVAGLDKVLREWLNDLSEPFEPDHKSIEAFEFRSRSGFAAHSHNHGGLDLFMSTSVAHLVGSGEHSALGIESWVNDQWNQNNELVAEDFPELHAKSDENPDAFFDAVYEYCSDEYSCVAWRVRAMYQGGGVLKVYAGFDKDAPYFRWKGQVNFEREVKFKTLSELKRKLKIMTNSLVESQKKDAA